MLRETELFLEDVRARLDELERAHLTKHERPLAGPQGAAVALSDGTELVNMCSNDYLGLANHPEVVRAAHAALDARGAGMASVRFICGTQDAHRELEERLAAFLECEDAILFPSAFDANGGLFETLFDDRDVIVSDELNHASIIDGIRLSKARRLRYRNRDLTDLERRLEEARGDARHVVIATDGVFSMDGAIAPLGELRALADAHGALLMVDDCHATGFVGARGRGTAEHAAILGRVDLLTGTLGKALGGASGGYVAGARDVVALLRQRSRPYLFSNALPPPVVAGALCALDLVENDPGLRERLWHNTELLRGALTRLGLPLIGDHHPIVPVVLGEAGLAAQVAERLIANGIYAVSFAYPVVPEGAARIRLQVSAAHDATQLARVVSAFEGIAQELERER
jgi:glycine C-acetyltransferase